MAENTIHILVGGYGADQVEDYIGEQIQKSVRSAIDAKITERIDAVIKEKLEAVAGEMVRERISNELDICLEEGWRRTNTWGKTCGDRITIKDRLSDVIGEGKNSAANKLFETIIHKEVTPILRKEAQRLAKDIAGRVDALVKGSLADVVRKAVGLEKQDGK
jgi:hypothetical protein